MENETTILLGFSLVDADYAADPAKWRRSGDVQAKTGPNEYIVCCPVGAEYRTSDGMVGFDIALLAMHSGIGRVQDDGVVDTRPVEELLAMVATADWPQKPSQLTRAHVTMGLERVNDHEICRFDKGNASFVHALRALASKIPGANQGS